MSDNRQGTVQRLVISVCPFCEEHILKCSYCGGYFVVGDTVECQGSGVRHACKDCME